MPPSPAPAAAQTFRQEVQRSSVLRSSGSGYEAPVTRLRGPGRIKNLPCLALGVGSGHRDSRATSPIRNRSPPPRTTEDTNVGVGVEGLEFIARPGRRTNLP